MRAGGAIEFYRAAQLLGQQANQLQTKGIRVAEVHVRWEANAGVADGHDHLSIGDGSQCNADLSALVAWKGVFQAIRQQFIDNQATGNGLLCFDPDRIGLDLQGDAVARGGIRLEDLCAEPMDIFGSRNAAHVAGLVEAFVDERDGLDTLLAILEERAHLRVRHRVGLQIQQAGDDLQVILDAMINFLEQDFLFGQGGFEVPLRPRLRSVMSVEMPQSA